MGTNTSPYHHECWVHWVLNRSLYLFFKIKGIHASKEVEFGFSWTTVLYFASVHFFHWPRDSTLVSAIMFVYGFLYGPFFYLKPQTVFRQQCGFKAIMRTSTTESLRDNGSLFLYLSTLSMTLCTKYDEIPNLTNNFLSCVQYCFREEDFPLRGPINNWGLVEMQDLKL